MRRTLALPCAILASATGVAGQLDLCRTRTLAFGGPQTDLAFALARDPAGNPFLAGTTEIAGGSPHTDAMVVAYTASGTLAWALRWGTAGDEGGEDAAIDPVSGGSLYVVGETAAASATLDATLMRVSPTGALLWSHAWDSGGDDHFDTVMVDSTGQVYVAGGTTRWSTSEDVLVIRYANARGSAQPPPPQVVTWDAVGMADSINSGCVDESLGPPIVYLAGNTQTQVPGRYELLLQKYDGSLALQWSRRFSRGTNDDAEVVACDAAGNVYVGGTTRDAGRTDDDALLTCWTATGNVAWSFQYGDRDDQNIASIAFGAQGTIHVTGQSSSGASVRGIYLVLDQAGNLLAARTLRGTPDAALGELYWDGAALHMVAALDGGACNFAPDAMPHVTTLNPGQSPLPGTLATRPAGTLAAYGSATPLLTGTGGGFDTALLRLQPCPAAFTPFGSGCAGSVGTPGVVACPGARPQLGTTFCVDVTGAPLGLPFPVMLLAAARLGTPFDLSLLGFPAGCNLYLDLSAYVAVGFAAATRWTVPIPLDPCLMRSRFFTQAVVPEPTLVPPLRLSNAAEGSIGF